jgi:3-deoxy-D-manno-octulosonate 8-phosphate phosphatase KdsC-like HAD superfamily phosphatase
MYSQQQPNQQNQQQGSSKVSSKELAYITDSLNNEELLAKIAVQAASVTQTPQFKQQMAQIAQERISNTKQLLSTLQQQTQMTH